MPRAEILTTQAMHTLRQLHAELAGKITDNKLTGDALRLQMQQVEAVMKLLDPAFNARSIAAKRRVTNNRWFKRGTMWRAAVGVLRVAKEPLTARQIADAMLAKEGVTDATDAERVNLGAGVMSSLRNHRGKLVEVTNEGWPWKWRLIS